MWCANHDDQNLTTGTMRTWDHACINSRVEVHVRCVEGALGFGGHVVIGVVRLVARFHHAGRNTNGRVLSFWIL